MFFFDCEQGYQPDNGQNDVTDGSVENYELDWETAGEVQPEQAPDAALNEK